jgi:hypothetical protein
MFRKIKKLLSDLENARKALDKEVTAANKLYKENRQLLGKIESAEKRGGVLLLNDIDTGLIEKLQSLTPDDNVIIIFTPDGGRIEIKHKDTNYGNKPGMVR